MGAGLELGHMLGPCAAALAEQCNGRARSIRCRPRALGHRPGPTSWRAPLACPPPARLRRLPARACR
eukprot:14985621-Alexandrium_andersonii.AAC.1